VSVLDRLARDLIVQETLLAEIRRLGAEPFTTSAAEAEFLADDPDDPSRKLIRQILGAVHEYERAVMAFRLKGGKAAKRARGGYVGGFVSLGKREDDSGEFVADEAELAAIARARELRESGLPLRAVADTPNTEGVPAKHADRWYASTVQRALRTGSTAS
jgi:DNA invertase Pin-like site-specific DNA recombinase